MVVELAKKSLLGKARERPDQVRRVLQKLRQEGLSETLRQVRAKLAEPIGLGYASAGVVLEVGRNVRWFRPGDRVASNGPHAEIVAVPQNLVARIPDGVSYDEACYGVVGAIALQGIRLAHVQVGDRVAVIGLGLVGQLAVGLLLASGCIVIGTDLDEWKCQLARGAGADAGCRDAFLSAVSERTNGHGADAVLITASTAGNGPIELATEAARKKGRLVVVGAVGMDVPRRGFYPKELELVVSCSYGPGRYDPTYEEKGQDYPYAYVRWTEQRNIETVLEQMAHKRLDVSRLTTHTFDIEEAGRAYRLMESAAEPYLGMVLTYPDWTGDLRAEQSISLGGSQHSRPVEQGEIGIGFIGAGNYASLVLLPTLGRVHGVRPEIICSAHGVNAASMGRQHGFGRATSSVEEVMDDERVQAVFIATRHDLHAGQALLALGRGKHAFVEKPLAINPEQLDEFERGLLELGERAPVWTLGFNRRFSLAARTVSEFFSTVAAPMTLSYRFNAGAIPQDHWTQDLEIGGGRLVGEACHALDLAAYLLRGQIVRVFAEAVAPGGGVGAGDDHTVVVARLDNGSVASIAYFAGGDKGFGKERVEVFGGGRVAVIDDFKTVALSEGGRTKTQRIAGRDKGHHAELEAFLAAMRAGGPPPIPSAQLLNVSTATLSVMESLRIGSPVAVRVYGL
jgi:predicted dehydrogenase/threonine dehydrogenase-like Zn-dependent dehydrogenase